jgi:hypothetical protein
LVLAGGFVVDAVTTIRAPGFGAALAANLHPAVTRAQPPRFAFAANWTFFHRAESGPEGADLSIAG